MAKGKGFGGFGGGFRLFDAIFRLFCGGFRELLKLRLEYGAARFKYFVRGLCRLYARLHRLRAGE